MDKGTIKFFNARKGFGFIAADEGGKEVFLPATALGELKAAQFVPGQRVEFKTVPDQKGPKVTQVRLLGKMVVAEAMSAAPSVTVYCDPASDTAQDVLDAIRKAGFSARVSDVATTPLAQDQLKRLSLSLGEAGQSLVRRSDSLFFALQLDDRFIGEADFWTGVIEHPSLINTPILVFSGKARICKSAKEAKTFIEGGAQPLEKPKALSPRLAALLRGESLPPPEIAEKSGKAGRKPARAAASEELPASPPTAKKAARKPTPPAKPKKVAAGAKKTKNTGTTAKTKKPVAPVKRKAPVRKSSKR